MYNLSTVQQHLVAVLPEVASFTWDIWCDFILQEEDDASLLSFFKLEMKGSSKYTYKSPPELFYVPSVE